MTQIRTDPLTFEALRHRITSIADEGSAVLSMVSSSPVASEANDCNVAIMDRNGAAVAIGPGLSSHGIGCMLTTRYVRAEYRDNPGIRPGDMFLANDPYRCTPHQTCFALISPVFVQGEIAAWVGAGIHVPDAGGPVAGQVSIGANSIYQEATPMLPMRIVEGDIIRKDLEAEYVVRSRTASQLALDLRAMVAACGRLKVRLTEMFDRYGVASITTVLEDMIEFTRAHLHERLASVPDDSWKSTSWLDYPGTDGKTSFYRCGLRLAKRGDRLILDFTDSSPQAPAVINCGEPGLVSAVLNACMALLCYGLPLCPEAVLRTIDVRSTPGTFVRAEYPAGCSKATTAACHAIRQVVNLALGKMLWATAPLRDRALAGTSGFLPVVEISGIDQRGDQFGAPLLDSGLSAGYGAMPGKDGIDSGGTLGSPLSSVANVETYEARYPVLYLWRRHATDSPGPGSYRGGCGVSLAFVPYRAGSELEVVLHGLGRTVPSTPGLGGGYPGGTNYFVLLRGTDITGSMATGELPERYEEFGGKVELVPGLYRSYLTAGDVVVISNNGGGGIGDPLERPPAAVAADIALGVVSESWARSAYGVVVRDGALDVRATEALRREIRLDRFDRLDGGHLASDDRLVPTCPACGPDAARPVSRRRALHELGPLVLRFVEEPQFDAEEWLCPNCASLVELAVVDRRTSEDP